VGACVVAVPSVPAGGAEPDALRWTASASTKTIALAAKAVAMVAFALLPSKPNPVVLWVAIRPQMKEKPD